MSWDTTTYTVTEFFLVCDECGNNSEVFASFQDMLDGSIELRWWVSPETFRCKSPQISYCPDCQSQVEIQNKINSHILQTQQ